MSYQILNKTSAFKGTCYARFVLINHFLGQVRIATGTSFQCPIGEAASCVAQHIRQLQCFLSVSGGYIMIGFVVATSVGRKAYI